MKIEPFMSMTETFTVLAIRIIAVIVMLAGLYYSFQPVTQLNGLLLIIVGLILNLTASLRVVHYAVGTLLQQPREKSE